MSTRIFYFTGSGNSLAIARTIANGLGDAEVEPVAKHINGFTGTDEERIGIITPVYAWGPPRIVGDFIKRLKVRQGQYVFAVADCGGSQGNTLVIVKKLLRANGANLDAGFAVRGDFSVKLPGMEEMGIVRFISRITRKAPVPFKDRADEIIRTVSDNSPHKLETNNWPVNLIGSLTYPAAIRVFTKGDRDFSVSDDCVSCGICAQVCPRENVKLVDGRPMWNSDCEMCYACFLWCPQKAIAYKGSPPIEPVHHPDVVLADILLR